MFEVIGRTNDKIYYVVYYKIVRGIGFHYLIYDPEQQIFYWSEARNFKYPTFEVLSDDIKKIIDEKLKIAQFQPYGSMIYKRKDL